MSKKLNIVIVLALVFSLMLSACTIKINGKEIGKSDEKTEQTVPEKPSNSAEATNPENHTGDTETDTANTETGKVDDTENKENTDDKSDDKTDTSDLTVENVKEKALPYDKNLVGTWELAESTSPELQDSSFTSFMSANYRFTYDGKFELLAAIGEFKMANTAEYYIVGDGVIGALTRDEDEVVLSTLNYTVSGDTLTLEADGETMEFNRVDDIDTTDFIRVNTMEELTEEQQALLQAELEKLFGDLGEYYGETYEVEDISSEFDTALFNFDGNDFDVYYADPVERDIKDRKYAASVGNLDDDIVEHNLVPYSIKTVDDGTFAAALSKALGLELKITNITDNVYDGTFSRSVYFESDYNGDADVNSLSIDIDGFGAWVDNAHINVYYKDGADMDVVNETALIVAEAIYGKHGVNIVKTLLNGDYDTEVFADTLVGTHEFSVDDWYNSFNISSYLYDTYNYEYSEPTCNYYTFDNGVKEFITELGCTVVNDNMLDESNYAALIDKYISGGTLSNAGVEKNGAYVSFDDGDRDDDINETLRLSTTDEYSIELSTSSGESFDVLIEDVNSKFDNLITDEMADEIKSFDYTSNSYSKVIKNARIYASGWSDYYSLAVEVVYW